MCSHHPNVTSEKYYLEKHPKNNRKTAQPKVPVISSKKLEILMFANCI